jgi:hypothetical protein
MKTRVTVRIGIDSKKPGQAHGQTGLFQGLANGSLLGAFPTIDEASGQRPSMWRVATLDEQNSLRGAVEYDIHRGERISLRNRCTAPCTCAAE